MQNRFSGLLRDTWWLWGAFLLIGITMTILVSRFFLVTFPMLIVAFTYYASMRYNDDGTHKGEDEEGRDIP